MKKVKPLFKPKYKELRDLGRTGFSDNLSPVESLDLDKVRSVDDLVRAMKKTAFGGRSVGEAADVLAACKVIGVCKPSRQGSYSCT